MVELSSEIGFISKDTTTRNPFFCPSEILPYYLITDIITVRIHIPLSQLSLGFHPHTHPRYQSRLSCASFVLVCSLRHGARR